MLKILIDGQGVKSLVKKYYKPLAKTALGAGLGATGAMIGFATGVSQGNVSSALQNAFIGGATGQGLGSKLGNGVNVGGIKNKINEIGDTWNEGAYGSEYAQNVKEIREFKSSSAYKNLKNTYGDNFSDENLGAMLQAGITEQKDMEKVLGSNNFDDAIGYYTLAKKCPDEIYYDDQKLQMYLQDLGLSQTDASTMRKNMRAFR